MAALAVPVVPAAPAVALAVPAVALAVPVVPAALAVALAAPATQHSTHHPSHRPVMTYLRASALSHRQL